MSGYAITTARPRGCFASITHSATTTSHLISDAAVHWLRDQPTLVVGTRCGVQLGHVTPVRTYMQVPDVHDLCDKCIFIDFLPSYEVYRFFAADGAVLYIGQTCDFLNRLRSHYTCSPWWPEVDRWTREPFDSLGDALDAEISAIRAECPRYNRLHNAGRAA